MTSQKDAEAGGFRRPDSPPLRGGGKPYESPIRRHRRAVLKWRQDGATFREIAAQLSERGVQVSSEAVRKFLHRQALHVTAMTPKSPSQASGNPALDTKAVQIMNPKKLVLNVTRPTPPPPPPPKAPEPELPDHLKPENWPWHADYKPKISDAVSHEEQTKI